MSKHMGMIKTASLLTVANLLVKVFGLLREILLAQYYGASIYTDAYIIANNIPTVLFAAIGTSLATTFIPMYSRVEHEKGEKRAQKFTINLIGIVFLICIIMTFLGEIFTKQFVFIFASGFEGEQLDLTITFARILFPSIMAMALMNIFGAFLQIKQEFKSIALVPVVGNLTIIFALILSNYFGNIYIFVWGTLLGISLQVLYYIPCIVKYGLFSRDNLGINKDPYIILLVPLVLPVFLGEAVNEVNSIVGRTLVSGLETGSVSSLNYAYKIVNLCTSVICGAINTVLYPQLTKLALEKKSEYFQQKASDALGLIFSLLLPLTAGIVIMRVEIVRLIFQRGNFNEWSVEITSQALVCYAIGLFGMGARDILVKIFFSIQDTKTPMKNGVLCAAFNIPLSIILIRLIGYKGAALATAIIAIVGCFNLFWLAFKLNLINVSTSYSVLLKSIVSTGISAFGLWINMVLLRVKLNFSISYIIAMTMIVLFWCLVYLGIQIALKNSLIVSVLKKWKI